VAPGNFAVCGRRRMSRLRMLRAIEPRVFRTDVAVCGRGKGLFESAAHLLYRVESKGIVALFACRKVGGDRVGRSVLRVFGQSPERFDGFVKLSGHECIIAK
jgi:hypothetical protein